MHFVVKSRLEANYANYLLKKDKNIHGHRLTKFAAQAGKNAKWMSVNFTQLKANNPGITIYLTPKDVVMDGIIKSRFSDLHVNKSD